jgi:hypothetical protein
VSIHDVTGFQFRETSAKNGSNCLNYHPGNPVPWLLKSRVKALATTLLRQQPAGDEQKIISQHHTLAKEKLFQNFILSLLSRSS